MTETHSFFALRNMKTFTVKATDDKMKGAGLE